MVSKHGASAVALVCLWALAAAAPGCTNNEDGADSDINYDFTFDLHDAAGEGEDVPAACRFDYDCSDGIYCNGIELCVEGACQPAAAPDCDDNLPCTADSCDEDLNTCRHDPDDRLCDDLNVCSGVERCLPTSPFADAATGCVTGTPVYCDDGNDCTEDYCDAETGLCKTRLKDADSDGYGDRQCYIVDEEGNRITGDDCSDGDPEINPDATEVCDDEIDNNCDRLVDLYDPNCLPDNDTCSTPTEIPATGGSVVGSTRGTADDYTTGCGGTSRLDVVFLLHLTEDHDVGLNAMGDFRPAVISVQATCGDGASELYCAENSLWARGLEAGDYTIIIEGATEGSFDLSVELAPYTNVYNVPPTNDDCSAPYVIPPEGGLFIGSTTGMANDFTASCGSGSSSPDAVFELTLDARMVLQATTETTYDGSLHLHSSPCSGGAEIACNDDYSDTRHSQFTSTVNAGTYFIVVDGYSSSNSGNYEMNVVITAPP